MASAFDSNAAFVTIQREHTALPQKCIMFTNGISSKLPVSRGSSLGSTGKSEVGYRPADFSHSAKSGLFFLAVFHSQAEIVACSTHTHIHVLGNFALKIAFSILNSWLPFINVFKSLDESANAFSV
jgi:hypothetical protein